MLRRALQLVLHALATGMLAILLFLVTRLHDNWMTVPMTRGVSLGISMELVIIVHFIVNLIISQIKQKELRLAGLLVFAGTALYLLLPFHPIRALFMVSAGVAVSILALLVGDRIGERIGT